MCCGGEEAPFDDDDDEVITACRGGATYHSNSWPKGAAVASRETFASGCTNIVTIDGRDTRSSNLCYTYNGNLRESSMIHLYGIYGLLLQMQGYDKQI